VHIVKQPPNPRYECEYCKQNECDYENCGRAAKRPATSTTWNARHIKTLKCDYPAFWHNDLL
jgi:hypothetical protein